MKIYVKLRKFCSYQNQMHCGVKDYNSMSEDKASESKTENFKEKDEEDSTLVPLLSEYSKKLESRVKPFYIKNISVIGIDPAKLSHGKLDPDCLPPIKATDLLSYLVLDTSYYTAEQFKAFKGLEAHNQMVSEFITSVQGKVIAGCCKRAILHRSMDKNQWKIGLNASQMHVAFTFLHERSYLRQSWRHQF